MSRVSCSLPALFPKDWFFGTIPSAQYRLKPCIDFPPSMPVVPLWPCRVCFGRLECTPTSLLHYTRAAAVKWSKRTQFGRRAFSVACLDIWNSLPATIHTIDFHPAFRRALKTHLFRSAFDNSFYIDIMHNRSIFNLYDWAINNFYDVMMW